LCRALDLLPVDAVTIRFLDMPHTHWSAAWIEPLYHKGLYHGLWSMEFNPNALVSRYELSLMIDRALDPFRTLPTGK